MEEISITVANYRLVLEEILSNNPQNWRSLAEAAQGIAASYTDWADDGVDVIIRKLDTESEIGDEALLRDLRQEAREYMHYKKKGDVATAVYLGARIAEKEHAAGDFESSDALRLRIRDAFVAGEETASLARGVRAMSVDASIFTGPAPTALIKITLTESLALFTDRVRNHMGVLKPQTGGALLDIMEHEYGPVSPLIRPQILASFNSACTAGN